MKKRNFICCLVAVLAIYQCAGLKPKPIFKPSEHTSGEHQPDSEKGFGNETSKERNLRINLIREKMMMQIDDLLGVPYLLGGTSHRGMDCSGLVWYVYKNSIDLSLPRRVTELYHLGRPVPKNQLQFGDLVFFKHIDSPDITHVGIYLDASHFVHASSSKGVIISSLRETYYSKRFVAARRIIE